MAVLSRAGARRQTGLALGQLVKPQDGVHLTSQLRAGGQYNIRIRHLIIIRNHRNSFNVVNE
jgi:hypothetical protein